MRTESDSEQEHIRRSLENGAKVVRYEYVISVLFYTFRRESKTVAVHSAFGRVMKGMYCNFISFCLGWWGIPLGPVYTPVAIFRNLRGGTDCTKEALDRLGISQDSISKKAKENNIKKAARMAGFAFVLGVCSLICNILTGIPGIILGHRAIILLNRYKVDKGKTLAVIGLVLSYLGSLLFALFVIFRHAS